MQNENIVYFRFPYRNKKIMDPTEKNWKRAGNVTDRLPFWRFYFIKDEMESF